MFVTRHSASADAGEPTGDPVAIVRAALATAVAGLASFDEHSPGAEFAAKRVLNRLAETLLPLQYALITATEADPGGPVASAMAFLRNAVQHIDQGAVSAARAAVVTAHVALARLDGHTADDPAHDPAPGDWRL
jgi:hypothetical protein